MLSFTTAHVAIVALRYKRARPRAPYRAPWNVRFRGHAMPLTRGARRDRDVRRLGLGRRAPRRGAHGRDRLDGVGMARLRRLPPAPGLDLTTRRTKIDRGPRARPTSCAGLPLRARAGLRLRRQRARAARRGQARRRGRQRRRDLRRWRCRASCRSTAGWRTRRTAAAPCSRARSSSAGARACGCAPALVRTRNPGRDDRRGGASGGAPRSSTSARPTARPPRARSGPRRGTCSASARAG